MEEPISRYGKQLRQSDLEEVHRRADNAFKRQLQQNFVVLYDSQTGGAQLEQKTLDSRVWVDSGRQQKGKCLQLVIRTGNASKGKKEKMAKAKLN